MMRDPLLGDFLGWARARAALGAVLILAGAVVEGLGVLMLIPVIGVLTGEAVTATGGGGGSGGGGNALLDGLMELIGPGTQSERLTRVILVFAAIIPLRFALLHWRDLVLMRLGQGFVLDLRLRLFEGLAALPWQRAADLVQGPIGHALSRDLDRASGSVLALLRGFGATVMLAVQIGLALWLAPWITLGVAVAVGVIYAALGPLRRRASTRGRALTDQDRRLFATVGGFLSGLKPAKAHGLEQAHIDGFRDAAADYRTGLQEIARDTSLGSLLMQSSIALLALLAVWAGDAVFGLGAGTLIVLMVIMVRISAPLQAIQSASQSIRHGREAYVAAMSHLPAGAASEPPAPAAAGTLADAPGFRLDGVGSHPDGAADPALAPLTAEIPAGQVTAIAGPSGVGKTTLCDLLIGLTTPDSGRILMDGTPFDAAQRARLRTGLAYVGQTGGPMGATLRLCLSWGGPRVDDRAAAAALGTVGAGWLADRLDAPLDVAGKGLSGGERQRVQLAWALLRAPKLLVLDEATNALDLEAEAAVLRALFEALPGTTVVMVSHRSETVALAATVIRLG